MPRQCRTPGRRRPASSGHGAGVRLLALAGGVAVAVLAAAPAAASGSGQVQSGRVAQPGHAAQPRDAAQPGHAAQPSQVRAAVPPISVAITSVNPTIATPNGKVTVSGTVTNATGTAAPGLDIRLWSSSVRLASHDAMAGYLSAPPGGVVDSPTPSRVVLSSAVPAHTTQSWSLTLRAKQVGMTAFGVYPLAAQVSQFGAPVNAARTFLPFWPGKSASRTVKPLSLAWVWPLIDVPHQGACPALLNDSLAGSLAGGGRLNRVLAVGSSALGRSAELTWAIDPALLNDANVMTARYRVGGTATCSGGAVHPASAAARAWLKEVQSAARQQDFFVTPYADVDVAALSHSGLTSELAGAFAEGRTEADAILGEKQRPSFAPDGGSARAGATGPIAWPPDGIADYSVLETLAASPNRIGTVILDSTMMPSTVGFTPTAVTTTPDGVYGQMHVLVADNGVAQILAAPPGSLPGTTPGTGGAKSSAAAAAFAREQWFLAETAMIAAQAPHTARAVVVAPPRRWNPGAALARALLAESVTTPWLRPASLSSLAAAKPPAHHVPRENPPLKQVSRTELTASFLRQVQRVEDQIGLLRSILVGPEPRYLSKAMAAVQSSAWSTSPGGRRTARQLLRKVAANVTDQQQQVIIVDPLRVTLGGKSGEVPVSISNHLGQPVRVRLRVTPSGSGVVIGKFSSPVTVDTGQQRTIKIPVRVAAAGSNVLTLSLTTPDGRLLRGSTARLTVAATHFGTMAIVIIGIALGVYVIAASARAIRRGGGRPGSDTGEGEAAEADQVTEADWAADADRAAQADRATEADQVTGASLTGPDPAYAGPEADTVERERPSEPDAAKEPDEHASTPGRAQRR